MPNCYTPGKKYDKFTTIYNVRDTLCVNVNIFRIILNRVRKVGKVSKVRRILPHAAWGLLLPNCQ